MTIEIGITTIIFGEIYGFQAVNPPDDNGCIYGLGSLGVALSAPATSSSQ
ncbi:hypothetical protein OROMI_015908 [Orobanche minor]